jgi:hypothetical protein
MDALVACTLGVRAWIGRAQALYRYRSAKEPLYIYCFINAAAHRVIAPSLLLQYRAAKTGTASS